MWIGDVRRSQLITTYGVGAIVPAGESAVMVAGIDHWKIDGRKDHDGREIKKAKEISEPRLAKKLSVDKFILPPATGKDKQQDIPVFRFPTMCWCSGCEALALHKMLSSDGKGRCACGGHLVPSRFVIACDKGHIDDFPFSEWVHTGKSWNEKHNHVLKIRAGGVSTSLSDVIISCECGVSRSMDGSFGKRAMKGILKECSGRRPWLNDKERCTLPPRTLQRGSSNVYFPLTESAISIPPWSKGPLRVIRDDWSVIKHVTDMRPFFESWRKEKGVSYSAEILERAAKKLLNEEMAPTSTIVEEGQDNDESLKSQEYQALMDGEPEAEFESDFVCESASGIPAEFESLISQVMQVKRLREVVALTGFTRVSDVSASDIKERKSPLYSKRPTSPSWLPAVEINGEGVSIHLNLDKINEWEEYQPVKDRAEKININYDKKFRDNKPPQVPDRIITPRFVMIHTLAHALINQWALDCGYPSASLKERLYVSDNMVGLLIYTASTDAAGSLGGVVAQADPTTLARTLREAIDKSSWCSSDPLCIEADAAGVDSLNLAACHACSLLPEVSCEERNLLLDRGLLVGIQEDPRIGFFHKFVAK